MALRMQRVTGMNAYAASALRTVHTLGSPLPSVAATMRPIGQSGAHVSFGAGNAVTGMVPSATPESSAPHAAPHAGESSGAAS